MSEADCLVVLPKDNDGVKEGDYVEVQPFEGMMSWDRASGWIKSKIKRLTQRVAPGILPPATLVHPCTSRNKDAEERGEITDSVSFRREFYSDSKCELFDTNPIYRDDEGF